MPDSGYMIVECSECNSMEIIRLTCKSRFCPSCGKKYRDRILASVQEKFYDVPHRKLLVRAMPGHEDIQLYSHNLRMRG